MATIENIMPNAISASRLSGASKVQYSKPTPFVTPAIRLVDNGVLEPVSQIPRETLLYSSKALEEIMFYLNEELGLRLGDAGKIRWRKYTRVAGATIEFEEFTPQTNGANLRSATLKFFPQYVQDIKNVINRLINDSNVPDTLGEYLTRIFANHTAAGTSSSWKASTKIKDAIKIINFDSITDVGSRLTTIDPLTNIRNATWPFDNNYISQVVPIIGVTPEGTLQVVDGPQGIESKDPNWPASVIGAGTTSGVAGFDVNMTRNNRPFRDAQGNPISRVHAVDTSQGVGQGEIDEDQGYTHLAHFPHVVEMLRYQPPKVEWFPRPEAVRDYVSPLSSNTTPNLPWVLAQPVIKGINQNWGDWLVKGNVGFVGTAAQIKALQNEQGDVAVTGQCPFSVFFPPPETTCSCSWTDNAYIIWFSNAETFIWEQKFHEQFGRGDPIPFGPNTVLRCNFSTNANAQELTGGVAGKQSSFSIGIRTQRIGSVNLQPFHRIFGPNDTEVNIQDALEGVSGLTYNKGGTDLITAIIIEVQSRDIRTKVVQVQDGPTGSFVPAGSAPVCELDTITATINNISIAEPVIGEEQDPVDDFQ